MQFQKNYRLQEKSNEQHELHDSSFFYSNNYTNNCTNKCTKSDVKNIVIFLHGYGADGRNLLDAFSQLKDFLPDTFFVAPNAPFVCEQNPFGYQWFSLTDSECEVALDLLSNSSMKKIREGINGVTPVIIDYILQKCKDWNVSLSNVSIVGFSQGAMLALDLLFKKELQGLKSILAYSGILCKELVAQNEIPNYDTEILLYHGKQDTVVEFEAFDKTSQALTRLGFKHIKAFSEDFLEHSISSNGINEAIKLLQKI
jgi:phospholipase/carboxylesterase